MTEKKPTPPIVYVLLTLAVVGVGWFFWGAMTSSNRANDQLTRDADEAERKLQELRDSLQSPSPSPSP